MPATWTQADQLQLLLLVIQQTNAKPDWNDISTKTGRTVSSLIQQYSKMKKMAATTTRDASPAATPNKKRPAKDAASGSCKKPKKSLAVSDHDNDDDEDEDADASPSKPEKKDEKVKEIKFEVVKGQAVKVEDDS